MPQLDFSNPLILSQVVWMGVIFLALYLLLSQWALPQVASVLDSRAARIQADLHAAHTSKASADAAAEEVQAATRQASAEGQGEIARAVAAAKAEAAARTAQDEAALDARIKEAEQRIATARTAAIGSLRTVATDTAAAVVTRLLGREAPAETVSAAVDRAISARSADFASARG